MNRIISLELAFVVHSRPFKETSLIAEFFTRGHGRISAVAKGAKRPKSSLKEVLSPTSLLRISCSGKNELKNLTSAEIIEYFPISGSLKLNCTFYLNELLMKLMEKEDPHPKVFDKYMDVIKILSKESIEIELEKNLRSFELILLSELGYGIDFSREANSGKKIEKDLTYCFDPLKGFVLNKSLQDDRRQLFSGKDILNFADGDLSSSQTRKASKNIMRSALEKHLGERVLNTRKILIEKR